MTLRALLSERNAQINTLHDIRVISVPAGNGQAGRAPDSRETILSLSPDRRHFYYYNEHCLVYSVRGTLPTVLSYEELYMYFIFIISQYLLRIRIIFNIY